MTGLSEKVAKLLGLPPDADTETILAEADRLVAERSVESAVNSGTILAAHRQVWLNSFKADHKGTAAALASMTPRAAAVTTYAALPAPPALVQQAEAGGDISDEEASAILWRLGVRAGLRPPPQGKIVPTLVDKDGSAWVAKGMNP